ncbi:MAG: hypothetical protein DWI25_07140 [Planctomycetota bacterium]|nr:MAG: hypothetical protein DWI25_07140 [Planctomycetota bacterium]
MARDVAQKASEGQNAPRCDEKRCCYESLLFLAAIPGSAGEVAARSTAIAGADLALANAGVTAAAAIALRAASIQLDSVRGDERHEGQSSPENQTVHGNS